MADADAPASEARSVWLGVASLCLVQFVDVLGVTVMVTALPAMLSDLHASPDAASLISTGYAMFFGGLLMFGARLGDRFGHRRIIFTGLAIFTVAAVAGATAPSVVVLTAARCLQGAAAAMSVPSALRRARRARRAGQGPAPLPEGRGSTTWRLAWFSYWGLGAPSFFSTLGMVKRLSSTVGLSSTFSMVMVIPAGAPLGLAWSENGKTTPSTVL